MISLDEYIENMKEGQTNIYYMTSDSVKSIQNSPFLDYFRSKDYEVLFMVDPLDEYITQQLRDYKEKKLLCITKENVDLNANEDEKQEQRIAKAQTFGKQDMMQFMMGKKILEISPKHEIVQKMKFRLDNNSETDMKDLVRLLYDLALQSSGFNIENSTDFISRVLNLISHDLNNITPKNTDITV